MKVIHLTRSFDAGGRRQVIVGLMEYLTRLGHECRVVVLGEDVGRVLEQYDAVATLGRQSLLDRRALGRLAELCRLERIDVIHTHDAASQFFAALLRLRHPRSTPPILMTFHRSLGIESATWRDRLRNRLACAVTGAVVTVSEERRRHFLQQNRVNPRKVVCIPNGIDAERYRRDPAVRDEVRAELGIDEHSIALGAVGHFGPEKGLGVVLCAFRELLAVAPSHDVRLFIAGSGSDGDRQGLEQLASECGGRVKFLGQRNDLPRLYQAFDILLHAPRQEAFGLVVVEAMAAGVPVIATSVGGIPEIIRDGETGRLVAPDAPAELAGAAKTLLESLELRREFGKRAAQVARDNFSVELQARRYLRVYDDLLAGRWPTADVQRAVTNSPAEPSASKIPEFETINV
jgi:glycosyltransferase involved in cell wall biosynthesis